jgi:hypothetical protein
MGKVLDQTTWILLRVYNQMIRMGNVLLDLTTWIATTDIWPYHWHELRFTGSDNMNSYWECIAKWFERVEFFCICHHEHSHCGSNAKFKFTITWRLIKQNCYKQRYRDQFKQENINKMFTLILHTYIYREWM